MDDTVALIALSRLQGLNRIEKKRLAENPANVVSLFLDKSAVKGNLLREKIASFKDWKMEEESKCRFKVQGQRGRQELKGQESFSRFSNYFSSLHEDACISFLFTDTEH